MAIKREGIDRWRSTLTGNVYSSEAAAFKYENLFRQQQKAANPSRLDKILDEMSADDIRKLGAALVVRAEEASDTQSIDAAFGELCANHPELITEGVQGTCNASALRTYLLTHGIRSMSLTDLEQAFTELRDRDVLYLDKSKAPVSEEDAENMPIEELRKKCGGGGGW